MPDGPILELRVVKSQFVDNKNMWRLEPGEYILGRHPSNNIVIPDPFVSRKHARIAFDGDKWVIEDLGSTNGTFVDGEDIRGLGPIEIKNGSEIVVGLTVLEARITGVEEEEAEKVEESVEEATSEAQEAAEETTEEAQAESQPVEEEREEGEGRREEEKPP